jgi:hypothetical protein
LFASTAEKVGAEVLPLDDVLDPPDMPDEPLPDAAGEDEDLSLLVLLDEELCAMATLDKANSAAAVAALRTFRLNIGKSSFG